MRKQTYEEFKSEEITAYLYHIPKIKVGCTNHLGRRTTELKKKYGSDVTIIKLAKVTAKRSLIADLESHFSLLYGFGEIVMNERYDSEGMYLCQFNNEKISGWAEINNKGRIKPGVLPWNTTAVKSKPRQREAWKLMPEIYDIWLRNGKPKSRELEHLVSESLGIIANLVSMHHKFLDDVELARITEGYEAWKQSGFV